MNMQQIVYTLKVYEKQSFTGAAQELYISQPSLSQAISTLEEELGFAIFERSRKGITATTAKGYRFIQEAQRVAQSFHGLERFRSDLSSSFRLSTTLVAQAQNAFMQLCRENISNPQLNLDLWFSGCNESTERVRDASSDLAVVTILDEQYGEWHRYFENANLSHCPLCASRFYVTVSRKSPLAEKAVVTSSDLVNYTYIAERCSRINALTMDVYALLDRICPENRVTVSNTDIMYRLTEQTYRNRTFILDSIPPDRRTQEHYGLASVPLESDSRIYLEYIVQKDVRETSLMHRYVEILREILQDTDGIRTAV